MDTGPRRGPWGAGHYPAVTDQAHAGPMEHHRDQDVPIGWGPPSGWGPPPTGRRPDAVAPAAVHESGPVPDPSGGPVGEIVGRSLGVRGARRAFVALVPLVLFLPILLIVWALVSNGRDGSVGAQVVWGILLAVIGGALLVRTASMGTEVISAAPGSTLLPRGRGLGDVRGGRPAVAGEDGRLGGGPPRADGGGGPGGTGAQRVPGVATRRGRSRGRRPERDPRRR